MAVGAAESVICRRDCEVRRRHAFQGQILIEMRPAVRFNVERLRRRTAHAWGWAPTPVAIVPALRLRGGHSTSRGGSLSTCSSAASGERLSRRWHYIYTAGERPILHRRAEVATSRPTWPRSATETAPLWRMRSLCMILPLDLRTSLRWQRRSLPAAQLQRAAEAADRPSSRPPGARQPHRSARSTLRHRPEKAIGNRQYIYIYESQYE